MRALSSVAVRRLHAQGFSELDEAALAELAPWLRVAPAACSAAAGVGTLLGLPALLWALMLPGACCALSGWHPFDLPYTLVLRRVRHTRSLPRYGPPRRFACLIATVWLGVTGGAFAAGLPLLGAILGAALTAATAVAASTDFCAGCYVYWCLMNFLAPPSGQRS